MFVFFMRGPCRKSRRSRAESTENLEYRTENAENFERFCAQSTVLKLSQRHPLHLTSTRCTGSLGPCAPFVPESSHFGAPAFGGGVIGMLTGDGFAGEEPGENTPGGEAKEPWLTGGFRTGGLTNGGT